MSDPGRGPGPREAADGPGAQPEETPRRRFALGPPRPGRKPALRTDEGERHASWMELFFDLVFVVSIAELAHLLHDDLSAGGFLRFAFLFVPVWWAWLTFSYHADLFDSDDAAFRLAMLSAMLVVAALAVSIYRVFEGGSFAFALCYVLLQALLVGLYARARRHADGAARGVSSRLALGFSLGALIWGGSLLAPEPYRYGLWALALAVQVATPVVAYLTVRPLLRHASHLPERLGLFVLIVLGETVFVAVRETAGTDWRPGSVLVAASGFAVVASLWWLYFDRFDESVTTGALAGGARELLVRGFLYSYAHLGVFAGLAASAVGVELAITHAAEPALSAGERVALCGGLGGALLALVVVQLSASRPPDRKVLGARLAVVVCATAAVPVGAYLRPPVLVGSVALVLVGLAVFEHARLEPAAGAPD